MTSMNILIRNLATMGLKTISPSVLSSTTYAQNQSLVRHFNIAHINRPKPGGAKNYRYSVHYPEDGEYTIKPLKTTKLGGRDPETGRIVVGTRGGGHKQNYRWVDWFRTGPKDGTYLEERVIDIRYDPIRSARLALVGSGDKLRYLIATENMKKGDLIRTSSAIPRIPVRPKEGDAHPVGALPIGTIVNCVEKFPGDGARLIKAAGTSGLITRKVGKQVILQLASKREVILEPECMATVGRVSNVDHGNEHVGSAQRRRWLGRRPASGLWQRKDGYCGRKIKPTLPPKPFVKRKSETPILRLTIPGEGPTRPVIPSTDRVS
ncbi:mitochondrial ribosomal protein L2 [Oratosquilla oratoria]|uniref:mitochondrial ribosomal protein L2 n=1 Tax=Oratosquilla oratoria TaxID=337810 RepID=UPI003F76BDA1